MPDPLTKNLVVRVSAEEARALDVLAARDGRTRSNYVRQIIRAELIRELAANPDLAQEALA